MTSCKEFKDNKDKRTKFIVEINIDDNENCRDMIVKDLIGIGWDFAEELADIIERG